MPSFIHRTQPFQELEINFPKMGFFFHGETLRIYHYLGDSYNHTLTNEDKIRIKAFADSLCIQ